MNVTEAEAVQPDMNFQSGADWKPDKDGQLWRKFQRLYKWLEMATEKLHKCFVGNVSGPDLADTLLWR